MTFRVRLVEGRPLEFSRIGRRPGFEARTRNFFVFVRARLRKIRSYAPPEAENEPASGVSLSFFVRPEKNRKSSFSKPTSRRPTRRSPGRSESAPPPIDRRPFSL